MAQETSLPNQPDTEPAGFARNLVRHGLGLVREDTQTLQVNVGLLCNQTCGHCHLNAGPGRKEVMSRQTVDQVAAWAGRVSFQTIDVTGGAPEMNPEIEYIVATFSALAPKLIFRSNLSALNSGGRENLMNLLKSRQVTIVASFPSLNEAQADAQRGGGIFKASIAALETLNTLGYGHPETGLELNLVSNPTGAFPAPNQEQAEERFRRTLDRKWGIVFNHLFSFSNAPLGRFRRWLERSGNLAAYLKKLSDGFNPCAVEGVMCRTLVSVSWDGYLYDCDFNLARGLPMGRRRVHVTEMDGRPEPGSPIATGDHCYTCTFGAGFT